MRKDSKPRPPLPIDTSDGKVPKQDRPPGPWRMSEGASQRIHQANGAAADYLLMNEHLRRMGIDDHTLRAVERRQWLKVQYLDRVERELRAFGTRIRNRTILATVCTSVLVAVFWFSDWSWSGSWSVAALVGLLLSIIYELCNFALIFKVRPEELVGPAEDDK